MNRKEELLKQKKKIDKELKEIAAEEIRQRIQGNQYKMNLLREYKDIWMDLAVHDRTSCSDDSVQNGFGSHSSGGYRCAKCALIEIVRDRDDTFEVQFDVRLNKIQ